MSMYSQQKSLSNFALTHVLLVALLARLKAVPLVPALSHVEVSTTPASLVRDISISATDKPTCPQITPRDAQHFGSGFGLCIEKASQNRSQCSSQLVSVGFPWVQRPAVVRF